MKLKKKTMIFIVVIIVVGCIIALVNRSYIIARRHIKEEKIEKVVRIDITEDVEKEISTVTTETGIVIRQYIPKEEKIVKVLRADTTGDGQKEILVATSKIVVDKAQTWNEVDIHVIQRKGLKDIRKWRLSTGEIFEEMFIEDINRDKKDEIVVLSISGNIGTVDIFVWDGSIYKKIFVNGAKGGIEIKDIDGDGIKEILLKGTGYGSDTENYIYKWDGKKYYLYKTEKAQP